MSEEHWKSHFLEDARAYWTPEETQKLVRGKDLLVMPAEAPILLRAMGLLHRDATMPPKERRKFFQLNHMLRLLRPPLEELMQAGKPLRIIDAGCGRAYLTMALAWCLKHVFEYPAEVLGIDRNHDLMEESSRRVQLVGLEDTLRFVAADLNEVALEEAWSEAFDSPFGLDVMMALHACDTATDDAIALAVSSDATLIAVAPCCQAELARGWGALGADAGPFSPVWQTPHLRREVAATLTDTFRKLLLEGVGYETRAVEFVASSHTPKNTLIRAMRRGGEDADARQRYDALKAASGGVGIKLERLLAE